MLQIPTPRSYVVRVPFEFSIALASVQPGKPEKLRLLYTFLRALYLGVVLDTRRAHIASRIVWPLFCGFSAPGADNNNNRYGSFTVS